VVEYPNASGPVPSATAVISSLNQADLYSDVVTDSSGYIYVSSVNLFDKTQGSVLVFAPTANGMAAPLRTITLSGDPHFVAVDTAGDIYVATAPLTGPLPVTIQEFAAGVNGNATPIRTITLPYDSTTAVGFPEGLAVDPSGNIVYASYAGTGSSIIQVLSPGQSGNATPARTISGPQSQILQIGGLALDAAGNIYAATQTQLDLTPNLLEFSGGTNGAATPINSISGKAAMLGQTSGLAVDAAGNIYVSGSTGLLRFTPGATGNAAPSIEGLYGGGNFAVH
jgi:sugar lactone lactonase YvrE